MIGKEKSAVEQLAERELQERKEKAYKEFLGPINEQIREERDRRQVHLDELGAKHAEKKQAEEERQRAIEEYQRKEEEAKPERTHEAYKKLLHGLTGEDN